MVGEFKELEKQKNTIEKLLKQKETLDAINRNQKEMIELQNKQYLLNEKVERVHGKGATSIKFKQNDPNFKEYLKITTKINELNKELNELKTVFNNNKVSEKEVTNLIASLPNNQIRKEAAQLVASLNLGKSKTQSNQQFAEQLVPGQKKPLKV